MLRCANAAGDPLGDLRHPAYAAPELLATGPNQLWSWDITKLKGPRAWTYFYLYVILDVFSRSPRGSPGRLDGDGARVGGDPLGSWRRNSLPKPAVRKAFNPIS